MNSRFLFLLMMLGMIEISSSIRASGEGMYTEIDDEVTDGEYPSLIDQTRRDIEQGEDEVDDGYEEEEFDEPEYNEMSEAPFQHQTRHKQLAWYQRLFENALTRLMGIRV